MFLHVSVIQSFVGEGEYDIPSCLIPCSFWGVWLLPVWSHVPSGGMVPEGVWSGGGVMVPGVGRGGVQYTLPLPWYWHLVATTKAGGTRPTRMRYCLEYFCCGKESISQPIYLFNNTLLPALLLYDFSVLTDFDKNNTRQAWWEMKHKSHSARINILK